ncbi:hypothetical protein DPMN_098157 [Dreissena polymorpha]|uniref:Uncharacterized protein n=1 Tax=Dreissena polymorpha TaxID=45954 RepID=A0A9D4LD50_DREPO|nr:hypothetical protein DPMN_098157 [Dreissena polymorpha]
MFERDKDICWESDWVGRTSRSTCSTIDSGCLCCISAIVHEGEHEEAVGLLHLPD